MGELRACIEGLDVGLRSLLFHWSVADDAWSAPQKGVIRDQVVQPLQGDIRRLVNQLGALERALDHLVDELER